MKRFTAEGALIIVTIIWGGTFVIIKEALTDVSPMVFISTRFIFAALLLLPFLKKFLSGVTSAEIKGGLILGLIYCMGFVTQTAGLNYTTATKSGFITGTFVVFTPIFQFIFEKKMPTRWNLVGVLLVVTGLIFLSSRGESVFDIFTEIGSNFNIGDFLTLICAVFYSGYIVYLDIISKKARFMPLVFMQISVTAAGGFIFIFLFSSLGIENIRTGFTTFVITAILYTSILATIVTTSLQTKFQKYVTPTKAGIIFSFEPICAAVFAYLFINERIGNFGVIGGIIIFAGLLVTEIFDNRTPEL